MTVKPFNPMPPLFPTDTYHTGICSAEENTGSNKMSRTSVSMGDNGILLRWVNINTQWIRSIYFTRERSDPANATPKEERVVSLDPRWKLITCASEAPLDESIWRCRLARH